MKRLLVLLSLGMLSISLCAQEKDSVRFTKSFKFEDGVFLSFESFKRNEPDYGWANLEAQMVRVSDSDLIKIEWIRLKEHNGAFLPLDSLWGLSLDGIPFIFAPREDVDFASFSMLKVRGKICYFSYEETATELVEIKAYNPLNGRPFRSAKVPRNKTIERDVILNFVTGQVEFFNVSNLLAWIEDDIGLWKTLRDLPPDEAEEKLLKCLLIYDDRNPVFIARN